MTAGEQRVVASCPVCGGAGAFEFSTADRYLGVHPDARHRVYRCGSCRCWYLEPIDPGMLGDYYPETYYEGDAPAGQGSWFSRKRVALRARTAAGPLKGGRVLDVGCGRGAFLVEMRRRGWSVTGTDWNSDNASRVSASLGMQVVGGPDAMAELEVESFDVVTLFHVLEHEDRPKDLLGEVRRVLAPGGRLVVGVPNGASVSRRLFGSSWAGFDVPRHRITFTPTALRSLLGEAGFDTISTRSRPTDQLADLDRTVGLWMGRRGRSSRLEQRAVGAVMAPIELLAGALGRGSVVYVVATRR